MCLKPEELIAVSFGVKDKHAEVAELMYSIALNCKLNVIQHKYIAQSLWLHFYN